MLTPQEVADWLGAPFADAQLEATTTAVNSYVDGLPSIARTSSGEWGPATRLGATMLAARLYKRRNSPNGLESFGEIGSTYVSRYDSDIARLLRLESFKIPRVG